MPISFLHDHPTIILPLSLRGALLMTSALEGVSAGLIITEKSVGRHIWIGLLLGRPWRLHAVSFRVAASLMEGIERGDPKSKTI